MSKKSKETSYISARETRRISRENQKITCKMKNADNEMYETPSMREPFIESLSKNTFDELAD